MNLFQNRRFFGIIEMEIAVKGTRISRRQKSSLEGAFLWYNKGMCYEGETKSL